MTPEPPSAGSPFSVTGLVEVSLVSSKLSSATAPSPVAASCFSCHVKSALSGTAGQVPVLTHGLGGVGGQFGSPILQAALAVVAKGEMSAGARAIPVAVSEVAASVPRSRRRGGCGGRCRDKVFPRLLL